MTIVPPRRGIWLYSYAQIRTRTRSGWVAISALGALCLFGGVAITGWLLFHPTDLHDRGGDVALCLGLMLLALGLIEFPAGIIYAYRRWRREPIDLWECETPNDPSLR